MIPMMRLGIKMLLLSFIAIAPLSACEPIVPMFLVLGGSATLAHSFVVLLLAILIKSTIYAWIHRGQSAVSAFGSMLAGNVLSTVVGGFAAAVVSGVPLIGLIGIALCAILPAKRLSGAFPRINGALSTIGIVIAMTALVLASLMLWAFSQSVLREHGSLTFYWAVKIGFVFTGLLCGLFITVFWEEWVISRMTGGGDLSNIIAANVITLGFVSLYAAVVILPKRLESPNFLVDLFNRLMTIVFC